MSRRKGRAWKNFIGWGVVLLVILIPSGCIAAAVAYPFFNLGFYISGASLVVMVILAVRSHLSYKYMSHERFAGSLERYLEEGYGFDDCCPGSIKDTLLEGYREEIMISFENRDSDHDERVRAIIAKLRQPRSGGTA